MSLKHGLLGLLNYGKMSGYDLDKAFKDSLSFVWQGQTCQVYRELNAMEKLGWLRSELVIQRERPNKKIYQITTQGKEELLRWLTDTSGGVHEMFHVRSAFLMRLFFGGEMPLEQSQDMIRGYRDKCRKVLQEMADAPESTKKYRALIEHPERADYWQMVALFGKIFYEASEQWANTVLAILEKKEKDT